MNTIDRLRPYVGVTGITTAQEAGEIGREFQTLFAPNDSHIGMAGYLVSDRTLTGGSEGRSRYANVKQLPTLLRESQNPVTLNMMHYRSSDRDTPLSSQILKLFAAGNMYADGLCRAVQLNMGLPRPDELAKVKGWLPDLKIVLALNRGALERHDPAQDYLNVYKRLKRYGQLMDYLIIDFSGGRGIPFASDQLAPHFRDLTREQLPQPVIVAGGFDAQNVGPRLKTITAITGVDHVGVDAEGGLRYPRQDDRTSRLHIPSTLAYMRSAAGVLNRKP